MKKLKYTLFAVLNLICTSAYSQTTDKVLEENYFTARNRFKKWFIEVG